MNYSPLRYPGGKTKLSELIKLIIKKVGVNSTSYVEPFAGGAGVALSLLFSNSVEHIVINDYDKAIYSVWRAIVEETEDLVQLIRDADVSINEWHKQKDIYINNSDKYSLELAFATFFLNRTNRSGILSAGPIGGYNQDGNYLIDVRFNKDVLIRKIEKIAEHKSQITVYNKDVHSLIDNYLPKFNNPFIYLDPPYFSKGQELYKNYFTQEDHQKIAKMISKLNCNWMVTYDIEPIILELYKKFSYRFFDLKYSVANKISASEIMILCNCKFWPTTKELENNKIKITLRNKVGKP